MQKQFSMDVWSRKVLNSLVVSGSILSPRCATNVAKRNSLPGEFHYIFSYLLLYYKIAHGFSLVHIPFWERIHWIEK